MVALADDPPYPRRRGPKRHVGDPVGVVLAGDVGGINTTLALLPAEPVFDRPLADQIVRHTTFASRSCPDLAAACADFLAGQAIAAAGFGVSGQTLDGRVTGVNLPWPVVREDLCAALACPRVALLTDLEAVAYGALELPPWSLHTLQVGRRRAGHIAVIAAGAGLGQGALFWDGRRHTPWSGAGGHADFAAETDAEAALLAWVRERLACQAGDDHVSWERVVSGPGIRLLFDYLVALRGVGVPPHVRAAVDHGDAPAVIAASARAGDCLACTDAVGWYVRLFARQAANWALAVMATGGVLIAGGVVPKLVPAFDSDAFRAAFADKGRFAPLLRQLPVHVVMDPRAGLYGAAAAARRLSSAGPGADP